MKFLDLLHRWSGAFLGVLLSVIGLTGTILAFRKSWIGVPGAQNGHVGDAASLSQAIEAISARAGSDLRGITFADDDFGLHEVSRFSGGGSYANPAGTIVESWHSNWERPELWLFDLHHQLLAGHNGETVVGVLGVIGILFSITGAILWWRTRKTFEFRVWPKRFSRPALVRHHRDLGIVALPLLLITFATGAMLIFRPLTALVLGPNAPQVVARELSAPVYRPVPLMDDPDWQAILTTAETRFPEARFRSLALPRGDNGMIRIRMRQPEEWLPNGRTILWFAADTGALIEAHDARDLSLQTTAYNGIYPIHSGDVGGWWWRIVVMATGLVLAMLGLFAFWSFWSSRAGRGGPRKPAPRRR